MKKSLLVAGLVMAFTSSSAMATSYFSKHVTNNETVIDFSVNQYSLDTGLVDLDKTGFELSVDHKSYRNAGIEASVESVNFDEIDSLMVRFGGNMNIIDHYKEFDVKGSVGVFNLDLEHDSQTSFYLGLSFQGEIIKDKLSGKVFTRYYDIDSEYYEASEVGAQINYHLDRNMNVFLSTQKQGDLKSVGVGVSYKF